MSENIGETGRDHRDADKARERETENGTEGGDERAGRRNEMEREYTERTVHTYMRLGNALIGLSDGFRVAPYRWDRSRFDKIEFHLESAVLAFAYPRYFILTLFAIVPSCFFF